MPNHILSRVRRAALAGGALVAAFAFATTPAQAAPTNGVVEVDHGIDFVVLSGYPARTPLRVEVLTPAGETIGVLDATTDASGGLEINHIGDNDCFSGGTAPDIQPGDQIRVTVNGDPAVQDLSLVRNVVLAETTGGSNVTITRPVEDDPLTVEDETQPGSIVVEGFAREPNAADGTPGAPLDNVEVRLQGSANWTATDRRDWRNAEVPDASGNFVSRFETNDEGDLDQAADAEVIAEWLGSNELTVFTQGASACPNSGDRTPIVVPVLPPPVVTPPRQTPTPPAPQVIERVVTVVQAASVPAQSGPSNDVPGRVRDISIINGVLRGTSPRRADIVRLTVRKNGRFVRRITVNVNDNGQRFTRRLARTAGRYSVTATAANEQNDRLRFGRSVTRIFRIR